MHKLEHWNVGGSVQRSGSTSLLYRYWSTGTGSSLVIFGSLLDVSLGTLLWRSLLEQELGQYPEGPANLSHCEITDPKPKTASALVNDASICCY